AVGDQLVVIGREHEIAARLAQRLGQVLARALERGRHGRMADLVQRHLPERLAQRLQRLEGLSVELAGGRLGHQSLTAAAAPPPRTAWRASNTSLARRA